MSEAFLERLSRFTPDAGGLDRDALLFAAGRTSARPNRGWVTAVSLLAATQVLSLTFLWPQPNPPAGGLSVSVAHVPEPSPDLKPPTSEASASPDVLSARPRLLELDLETQPAADVTFIDPGPPLRAGVSLASSLLN